MKVRLERDVMADAVAWVARTLPSRPSQPILAAILIESSYTGTDEVVLSGFDKETSAQVHVSADVSEPGRVLVSGRLLAEIARALPAQPVELILHDRQLAVRCGRASFTLPTFNVEDYPRLPDMPDSSGTIPGAIFAEAVAQVALAAGRDDTLPVLTGVRLEVAGDSITLAATDRYRLAVREFNWSPQHPGIDTQALIPARVLADTAKALAGADEVHLALAQGGEGLLGISGHGRRTTTRLLDGEFPKYRSLLPTESVSTATLSTADLVEAVKRVALVAERNSPLRLSFNGGEVNLSAGTGDEARADEAVECTLDGESIDIAFNPQYLIDGLGAIDSPITHMSFTASSRPAVVTGMTEPGALSQTQYRYLLMPIRLAG